MAKEKILSFTVMYVLHVWILCLDLVPPCLTGSVAGIPLGMVPDSVDDRYDGCETEMKEKVLNHYLQNELNKMKNFKNAWTTAKICAKKRIDMAKKDKLTLEHVMAICAYTAGNPSIYSEFNTAVRTNGNNYENFQFHALHYFLTDALHILRKSKKKNLCYNTYRRTNLTFERQRTKSMRFGQFASSSLSKDIHAGFGNKSCFQIKTCFGAYLKSYSALGDHEKEVLIPPFEKFKISRNQKKGNILNCEDLYILKSNGFESNLNCKAV
ncbi:hypothetical protein UPYG_G00044230 [Umbra pygmaea]|uniref:NAD(P)(+)--arginine ADP-ribosyltransferase n=1 Tax=Umbra pygmaea TaxID=75934 RepID=A0ABD0Y9D7_UMBPY